MKMCPYCGNNVKMTEGGNLYCLACGVLWVRRDGEDFMMTMRDLKNSLNLRGWIKVPSGCLVVRQGVEM